MTWERAECKEMEEAFKRQASNMDEVFHQNQELGACLVNLEKLWLAEEQFTMELHGCVEALQVHSSLWGVFPLLMTNILRIKPTSVGCLGPGRFLLR